MASNRLDNVAAWIGEGLATFNETTLTIPGQLGGFYEKNGVKYQLVLVDSGSNALAVNDVVLWKDSSLFSVTNDVSDVSGTSANAANSPAGIAASVTSAGKYGWIAVRGDVTIRTNQDDDIALGDVIIADGDEDGQCDSVAAGAAITAIPLAVAVAADDDTADTVLGRLIVPLNGA